MKKAACPLFFFLLQCIVALRITSPTEDQMFYAGDEFSVIVKPDPGEDWLGVMDGIEEMNYNILLKEYSVRVKIPADMLGYQYISAIGVDKSGEDVELRRRISVKLPSNVILQSISVNKDFMLPYKLPAGSSPTDYQKFFKSKQISVGCLYSDGVERDLTFSANGTTYTSSNEKVVTVSPDGKATAQGFGTSRITVRNGKFTAQVDIEVLPYRQPQK